MDMIGEIPLHIVGTGANRIPPYIQLSHFLTVTLFIANYYK